MSSPASPLFDMSKAVPIGGAPAPKPLFDMSKAVPVAGLPQNGAVGYTPPPAAPLAQTAGDVALPATAPPIPQSASDNRGALAKAWDWGSKGLIAPGSFLGAAGAMGSKPRMPAGAEALNLREGESMEDYIQRLRTEPVTPFEAQHPWLSGALRGLAGTAGSVADVESSFTSPLSIGMAGLGAAGRIPGSAGAIARAISAATGAGLAAKGASDVGNAVVDPGQNAWEKAGSIAQGGALAAGGIAAAGEAARPWVGKLADAWNYPNAEMMGKVRPGKEFTPAEIKQAAVDEKIPMTEAEITQNPEQLRQQAAVERGLMSGPLEEHAGQQYQALQDWANRTQQMYGRDLSPEDRGVAMQMTLEDSLAKMRADANAAFKDLAAKTGGVNVDVSPVQQAAKEIVNSKQSYFDKFPALKPKRAWDLVQALAGQKEPVSFADAQSLRSDLLGESRIDPDMVKEEPRSWYKRLTGAVDDALMDAAAKLPGDLEGQFRQANALWENLKSTFDSPQSPFYWAIREADPGKVPGLLVKNQGGTPQLARDLRTQLGPNFGLVKQEVVQRLIDPKGSGQPEFTKMASRLNSYRQDFLDNVFEPKELDRLGQVAEIARTGAGASRIESPSQTPKGTTREGEFKQFFSAPFAALEGLKESGPPGALAGAGRELAVPLAKGWLAKRMVDQARVAAQTQIPPANWPYGRGAFARAVTAPGRPIPGQFASQVAAVGARKRNDQ